MIDNNQIMIIAAEASSSLYAERLLQYWQTKGRALKAFGVGSRAMENLGFECLGRSEDMAVVGVQEVLAHFKDIRQIFYKLLEEAERRRPAVVLLLDYPEFNFQLAQRLKKLGLKVVYYISPQLWAWRKGRIRRVQRDIDRMLVLFPFEKDFYQSHGVQVDFVGHPLLDELDPELDDLTVRRNRRARYSIRESDHVLALMPGSRRSEIRHHWQSMIQAAELCLKKRPQTKVLLFVAPSLSREFFAPLLKDVPFELQIVQADPFEMIQLADVICVASGTATLMVGLMRVPMVIMYRMNALSAWLARRLVNTTPFFGLSNLILGRPVVPELFQDEATPEVMSEELLRFLNDDKLRADTQEELGELRHRLGSRGATERVAAVLEQYFDKKLPVEQVTSDKSVVTVQKNINMIDLATGAVSPVLMVLSLIFSVVTVLRNWLYDQRVFFPLQVHSKLLRVISVGNITVGGTGKTPFVKMLSEKLIEKGRKPGIISRGYKSQMEKPGALIQTSQALPSSSSSSSSTSISTSASAAQIYGDEPVWLSQQLPTVPVYVGKNKSHSLLELLKQLPQLDTVIADDAFQHRKLHRDLDIVLIDATRTISEYRLLPRGRLRESMRSLRRAHVVVLTKVNLVENEMQLWAVKTKITPHLARHALFLELDSRISRVLSFADWRASVSAAAAAAAAAAAQAQAQVEAQSALRVTGLSHKPLINGRILLVSAIAQPWTFHKIIKDYLASQASATAAQVSATLDLPDHAYYGAVELQKIKDLIRTHNIQHIVITEKDAVKWPLESLQELLPATLYVACLDLIPSGSSLANIHAWNRFYNDVL